MNQKATSQYKPVSRRAALGKILGFTTTSILSLLSFHTVTGCSDNKTPSQDFIPESLKHQWLTTSAKMIHELENIAEKQPDLQTLYNSFVKQKDQTDLFWPEYLSRRWETIERLNRLAQSIEDTSSILVNITTFEPNLENSWKTPQKHLIKKEVEDTVLQDIIENTYWPATVTTKQLAIFANTFRQLATNLEEQVRDMLLIKEFPAINQFDPSSASKPFINPGDITLLDGDVECMAMGESIECEDPNFIALVVIVVVAIIVSIGKLLTGGSDKKGKQFRKAIESMSATNISSLPIDTIKEMFYEMMNDGTGNKQERAIVKVLEALGCDRVGGSFWFRDDIPHKPGKRTKHGSWGNWILKSVDGDNARELYAFLNECRLLDFTMLSSNQVRNFLEFSDKSTISRLTDEQIHQLLLSILAGSVGETKERLIVDKIIMCLPCERIQAFLSRGGTQLSDFQQKLDGVERDQLEMKVSDCRL